MLAYPVALLMLLGFAASFALLSGVSSAPDDDDPPPEGEELTGTDGDDLLEGGAGSTPSLAAKATICFRRP